MIATLDRIDIATKRFSTNIIGLIDKWPKSHQRETEEMVRYVLSDKWKASKYAEQTVLDESQDNEKLRKVCQSLYFESVSHRETSIPKRHAATFEWIFHKPQPSEDGHALWSEFPLWLRGASPDIYWITGKPGAGKSTLLKFISRDPRFEALLQEWAAESQLLIIRFFSWTSGTNKLQKSQEGLFRTFLFEAIQQQPQLAIKIFPERWFLLQSFNGNIELPALTMDTLRAGFRNLLSATRDRLRLALIIDGLDEFDEDDRENHRDLVQLLRDANTETGVKICVSSRPWNVFRDEYEKTPMLQLENLTREDIQSFVQEKLQLSPGYRDFAATHQQAAYKIITDIVDKSQGVFLWVTVISGLLEAALQEGTSISELQATVDNLPKQVDELFYYIWNRTSKRFRAEASQYFRLMRICQDNHTDLLALTLWFGDKDFPVNFDAAHVTRTYLDGAIKTLERKLMSRTGGLLELVSRPKSYTRNSKEFHVDYMHRTANDWVRDNWASINSATDPGFDPFFSFVKGQSLGVVLTTTPTIANLNGLNDWSRLFNMASLIPENHPDRGILVAALDRLDHHLVSHMPKHRFQVSLTDYWANHVMLLFDDNDKLQQAFSEQQIDFKTLACTSFLELSALIPIPVYLSQKNQEDPHLLSTSSYILRNVIFGEILSSEPTIRLNILKLIIQGKSCPPLESLRKAKQEAKRAAAAAHETNPTNHPMFTYFTEVEHTLESRIRASSVHFASWLKLDRYWRRRRRH